MSQLSLVDRIPGKFGYFLIYSTKDWLSTKFIVEKPNGSRSGTFNDLRNALEYVHRKIRGG